MNNRSPRNIGLALILSLLAMEGVLAAEGRGRVTGKVVDADGKPIAGGVLTFTPVDPGLGEPRTVETNKKGRFSDLRFPLGDWKIDPRVGDYFLESLTLTVLDPEGLKRSTWGAKAHPKDGFPPVQAVVGGTIRLDLVAADPAVARELERGAAFAQNAATIDRIGEMFNAGKSEETLAAAEALLAKEPDLGPAIYLRGAALNRLGRREEAIADLRRARELMPEQTAMGGMLGEALLARALDLEDGNPEAARPLASEAADLLAVEASDTSPFGQKWNLALALKTAGRDDELRAVLEKMVELHSDQPGSFQELAEVQFRAGQDDQALATLDRMPSSGARNGAILLFNQALVWFDAGRHDDALELLGRAKTLDPGFVMLLNLEAQILISKGDRGGAAKALRRFIEQAPEGTDTTSARKTLAALEPKAGEQ